MKLSFDDLKWQRLQDDLHVAQLCGENAGKVYPFAKAALQQAVAAIIGERDVPPDDGAHALDMLRKMRNAAQDAALGFQAAVTLMDEQIAQLEPAAPRHRRRASAG